MQELDQILVLNKIKGKDGQRVFNFHNKSHKTPIDKKRLKIKSQLNI